MPAASGKTQTALCSGAVRDISMIWISTVHVEDACFDDPVQACQGQATDQGVNVTDR